MNKEIEKMNYYANYFNDCIENDFKNFSEDKYIEALDDINDIILNIENLNTNIVSYDKYLLWFLTENKKFKLRKYKLKKIKKLNE